METRRRGNWQLWILNFGFWLSYLSPLSSLPPPHTSPPPHTTAKKLPPAIAQAILDLKTTKKRWLEIDLSAQRLIAWNGSKPAYAVIISTGKKATPTPTGIFSIYSKRRLDRMRGEDYDIADVPYALYFHQGYAIHGTYWHNRFGTPVSHGCINVAVDHAKWLFEWVAIGTPVIIHN